MGLLRCPKAVPDSSVLVPPEGGACSGEPVHPVVNRTPVVRPEIKPDAAADPEGSAAGRARFLGGPKAPAVTRSSGHFCPKASDSRIVWVATCSPEGGQAAPAGGAPRSSVGRLSAGLGPEGLRSTAPSRSSRRKSVASRALLRCRLPPEGGWLLRRAAAASRLPKGPPVCHLASGTRGCFRLALRTRRYIKPVSR